jgi:hypothetical protein
MDSIAEDHSWHWTVGLGILAVAVVYLCQWLQLPLYSDEVAFRLLKSRYLADGTINFGLVPCQANVQPIPVIFRPVAYFLSIVDFALDWTMVRGGPLLAVLLLLATALLLLLRRGAIEASLILTAGLIGVAGAGLLLSRGETPMLLLGSVCLIGYAIIDRGRNHAVMAGIYLTIAAWLALLAFFIHLEALILAPVLLLILAAIGFQQRSRATRVLACLSVVCVIAGAWASVNSTKVSCPEFPIIEATVSTMGLPGFLSQSSRTEIENYFKEKLPDYADQFVFKAEYDLNYLPGVDQASHSDLLSVLNGAIRYTVLLNLIVAFCVMIILGVFGAMTLLRKGGSCGENLLLLLRAPSVYLFLGIAGHLALLVYDVPTAFYRSFHIHFMLVILNALALSSLRGKARWALWPIGFAALFLSLSSAVMSGLEMGDKFAAGWSGPSLTLQTDWNAVCADVKQASKMCQIAADDGGIVIDDLTFDAMKRHRHLIPITYLGYPPNFPLSQTELGRRLRDISATMIIARCELVQNFGFTPQYERNGICCLKF